MRKLGVQCMSAIPELEGRDSWIPASLAEVVSYDFSERPYLKIQSGEMSKETPIC